MERGLWLLLPLKIEFCAVANAQGTGGAGVLQSYVLGIDSESCMLALPVSMTEVRLAVSS